ncbi:NAD(P)/FAD-dependent oxidoreductase [Pseudoflavitalea rhizosphaerae]|uniref:NAD(P)/FAD-dependent oxidoreductase n=1 Tax=Pseudoflavitalea rhizosphaerae TaxID=1884793 RepID=UPI000F8E524A|nr:FAD/NAD(P)-binding oxidoreductase [Pseudoflavitalea rhizosphaerae]
MSNHYQVVIAGGGNAGISVAAQLKRSNAALQIVVIDPSDKHYYQPAWTLVGSGVFDIKDTERTESSVIPKGVQWIQQRITEMQPEQNALVLHNGDRISYEYLIVAVGIQLNWHEIKGLPETLGKNNVCSNYSFSHAPYTFECIKNFRGGNAIFTNPHTPVKCGGAPQKIMYMAADYFRRHHLLNKANIQLWSGGTRLFGVPKYEQTLLKVCERNNISLNFHVKLTAIDGEHRKATFTGIGEANKDKEYIVDYDMIHVTPPQSAPDFIRQSALANAAGWVDVHKHTLQHVKYNNVFSLGDVAGLPTSKTGAAVRKQAPVLVKNLLAVMAGRQPEAQYQGYTSCPLLTGYGKLVLAEFDYNNKPVETFPFNQAKERWSMYMLKRYVLPWLYWHKILQGKA